MNPIRDKKSRLFKVLAYCLGVGLVFVLVIEFLFPRLKGFSREDYICPWLGDRNTTFLGTEINAQGLTGDLIRPRKVPGEIEVLTLGGSSFYLHKLTDKLKSALTGRLGDNVRVTGGVFPGNDSRASMIKYNNLLPRHDYDYLLICHGLNDLWANRVAPEAFRTDYTHLESSYKELSSVIMRLIYDNLIWTEPAQTDEYDHYPSEETFRDNLSWLIRKARSRGTEVILMTYASYIPEDYTKTLLERDRLDYNKEDRILHSPVEEWGTVEHVKEGLRRHNRVIRELAAQYGLGLIDQDLLIPDEGYWFNDFCHFSGPGVGKFIENIVDYFQNNKPQEQDNIVGLNKDEK